MVAAIGTYGVLAYDVSERSREIALRMALRAAPREIFRMILRRTDVLALPATWRDWGFSGPAWIADRVRALSEDSLVRLGGIAPR